MTAAVTSKEAPHATAERSSCVVNSVGDSIPYARTIRAMTEEMRKNSSAFVRFSGVTALPVARNRFGPNRRAMTSSA